jgi:hypothetical protein
MNSTQEFIYLFFKGPDIKLLTPLLVRKTAHKKVKKKIKISLYRPWRPLGLREVETPTFSDIRLTDGGKIVSPKRRPLFFPAKFVVLISVRG